MSILLVWKSHFIYFIITIIINLFKVGLGTYTYLALAFSYLQTKCKIIYALIINKTEKSYINNANTHSFS